MSVRKGDTVRRTGDIHEVGTVRRVSHRATKAHVKWEATDKDIPVKKRKTTEDVSSLEVLKSRKKTA
jgi:hypothetical protein